MTVPPSPARRVADYLELTKPGITRMVLLTTAVGFVLGSSHAIDLLRLLQTLIGTGLVAAGAGALNQHGEWRTDARMNRTRDRPVPAGRIPPARALLFGATLGTVGIAALVVWSGHLAAALALASLGSYVLVYTPLKPITSISTLVGGIPGALPILIGWTAAGRGLTPAAWSLFGIMFLWQIPHFLALAWIYREDYRAGGLAMRTVDDPRGDATARQTTAYSLALLPVSLLPTAYGLAGNAYFFIAFLLSCAYVWLSLQLARRRDLTRARRLFFGSLLYLPVILGVLVLDHWLL